MQPLLAGLNLFYLLGENRIRDFHNELELLSLEILESAHVYQAILIEQWLSEGSHGKLANIEVEDSLQDFVQPITTILSTICSRSQNKYISMKTKLEERKNQDCETERELFWLEKTFKNVELEDTLVS